VSALAIVAGVVIGLTLGALGGGGSILTVPVLVYLLGQDSHTATTGSLVIVGVTALAGALAHLREGRVRVAAGLAFGLTGLAGTYAGARLSTQLDPHVLLIAFSALMIVAAVAMLRRRRAAEGLAAGSHGASHFGGRGTLPVAGFRFGSLDLVGIARLVGAATLVGLLTGFFGVGGGFVIVPALVLTLGFSMRDAVGTSLLVIAIVSAAALATRLGGHVQLDWPLLAAFTLAAVVGTVIGNRVASRLHPSRLTAAFVVVLVGVAVYTAARSIPYVL
jgi:uncharacterized membrane protein YfcA